MKLRGGYNISLKGKPSKDIDAAPPVDTLFLPLKSRRFSFTNILVKDGEKVQPGQILASDPGNYDLPLLAPYGGNVNLSKAQGHITLLNVKGTVGDVANGKDTDKHISKVQETAEAKRKKLLQMGAWEFFADAHTGQVPDPSANPSALIISTIRLDSYVTRGDAQLHIYLSHFMRGIEHLQQFLEFQPIYLVLPDIQSALAEKVKEAIRGYAWVKIILTPLRFPFGNYNLLARHIGLKKKEGESVWALPTAGLLAVERVLTHSLPVVERIVSVAGPAVKSPRHLKLVAGYPIKSLVKSYTDGSPVRVIDGGVLKGHEVGTDQLGVTPECEGITILPKKVERELLSFMRPGFDRRSYSSCFLSLLRGEFLENLGLGLRGERRPCISCGFCEEVCPAGIMPHHIHKLLFADAIEEAQEARVDLCMACGLCSYVCPSKLDLREQFVKCQEAIRAEGHEEEVSA